jgi:heme A synthase
VFESLQESDLADHLRTWTLVALAAFLLVEAYFYFMPFLREIPRWWYAPAFAVLLLGCLAGLIGGGFATWHHWQRRSWRAAGWGLALLATIAWCGALAYQLSFAVRAFLTGAF